MGTIDLSVLGLTPDQLRDLVVERIANQVMRGVEIDEDGEYETDSTFARKLDEKVRAHVDAKIEALAKEHILPDVTQFIEGLCLRETNRWGEEKSGALTLTEYIVARAEAYMHEKVDYEGRARSECEYSWKAKGTRIAYMVDRHLHDRIKEAMAEALKAANGILVGGLEKAAKMKLREIAEALRVTVSTG